MHVITPRNLFASGGQTTVGGEDRRLEDTIDGGRIPRQDNGQTVVHSEEASRTIDSLAERYGGRVSRVDLLALIRDLEGRPEEVGMASGTTHTGRDGYEKELPRGQNPRNNGGSSRQEYRGFDGRTERDPILIEQRKGHGGSRDSSSKERRLRSRKQCNNRFLSHPLL